MTRGGVPAVGVRVAFAARTGQFAIVVGLTPFLLASWLSGCQKPLPPEPPRGSASSTVTTLELAREALALARQHARLTTHRHSPWELVHAALGLGLERELTTERDESLTLRQYFRDGGPYLSQSLYIGAVGRVRLRASNFRGEVERHPNQFLAYFAQSGMPLNEALRSDSGDFAVSDLVESAQRGFTPEEEVTFTLIALSHYVSARDVWLTRTGRRTSLVQLTELELSRKDAPDSACRGAHRLYALACADEALGLTEDPEANALRSMLQQEFATQIAAARQRQLPGGALPWPTGSAADLETTAPASDDTVAQLYSTGHTVEWILRRLPPSEWDAPWIDQSVRFLAGTIIDRCRRQPPAAEWYHAVHALRIYCEASRAPFAVSG